MLIIFLNLIHHEHPAIIFKLFRNCRRINRLELLRLFRCFLHTLFQDLALSFKFYHLFFLLAFFLCNACFISFNLSISGICFSLSLLLLHEKLLLHSLSLFLLTLNHLLFECLLPSLLCSLPFLSLLFFHSFLSSVHILLLLA